MLNLHAYALLVFLEQRLPFAPKEKAGRQFSMVFPDLAHDLGKLLCCDRYKRAEPGRSASGCDMRRQNQTNETCS